MCLYNTFPAFFPSEDERWSFCANDVFENNETICAILSLRGPDIFQSLIRRSDDNNNYSHFAAKAANKVWYILWVDTWKCLFRGEFRMFKATMTIKCPSFNDLFVWMCWKVSFQSSMIFAVYVEIWRVSWMGSQNYSSIDRIRKR